MPCSDVTEVLEIRLDDADRLESYSFVKRTCGQAVGEAALILDWVRGESADFFLTVQPEDFLDTHGITDSLEEFLVLKHLFAIQSAVEVHFGLAPGRPDDAFAPSAIEYEDGVTVVRGLIALDIVTDKIASCGNCRGCGKTSARRKAAAART